MRLIHNVGHCLKNPYTSLERGTHFEGHFTYDSKDLWIAACTSNEQQHSKLFQGLSQCALSQLDKRSEELASQRVSDTVIFTLKSIFCFRRTDIPELYKPWTSTSSNHSTVIGASLFIVISKHGVVSYHDHSKADLHYSRQTPIQRKVYTMSCGFLTDGEENQLSDSEMEAKNAKWKSIGRLALMNGYDPEKKSTKFDNLLLVADTALQCIKYAPNISCLWRSPRETFSICKLNLVFDHEWKGADSCHSH